jgi:hypothetical protein
MATASIYERYARLKKAAELVAAIDNHARSICSDFTQTQFVDALKAMDARWWAGMAKDARVNAPSAETTELVIAIFEARVPAEKDCTACDGVGHVSHCDHPDCQKTVRCEECNGTGRASPEDRAIASIEASYAQSAALAPQGRTATLEEMREIADQGEASIRRKSAEGAFGDSRYELQAGFDSFKTGGMA